MNEKARQRIQNAVYEIRQAKGSVMWDGTKMRYGKDVVEMMGQIETWPPSRVNGLIRDLEQIVHTMRWCQKHAKGEGLKPSDCVPYVEMGHDILTVGKVRWGWM